MFKEKIPEIVSLIRKECQPKRIILFGSQARNMATPSSDLDIMVILEKVIDRRREMVKIRRLLLPLGIKVDVLVVTDKTFTEWCETPGNVYFEASEDGVVLFDEKAAWTSQKVS